MKLRYEILFEIHLHHNYYKNNECTQLAIYPTDDCEQMIKKKKMIYRTIGNKFFLLVEAKDGVPKYHIRKEDKFSFYVKFKTPLFLNFTNISIYDTRKFICYLSNLSFNKEGERYYLSEPIAEYDKEKDYQFGDMVKDKDTVYEAIQDHKGQKPKANSNFWLSNTADEQYVTSQDKVVVLRKMNEVYDLKQLNMKVYGVDPDTGTLDKLVIDSEQVNINTARTAYNNLGYLPRGVYRVDMPDNKFKVYVDAEQYRVSPFGVIEIFNNDKIQKEYRLLDDNKRVLSPVYTVQFNTRSTFWRYKLFRHKGDSLVDVNGDYAFDKLNDKMFISEIPIQLKQKPIDSLELRLTPRGKLTPLPNANINMIIPIDGKIYSDIYLNI